MDRYDLKQCQKCNIHYQKKYIYFTDVSRVSEYLKFSIARGWTKTYCHKREIFKHFTY